MLDLKSGPCTCALNTFPLSHLSSPSSVCEWCFTVACDYWNWLSGRTVFHYTNCNSGSLCWVHLSVSCFSVLKFLMKEKVILVTNYSLAFNFTQFFLCIEFLLYVQRMVRTRKQIWSAARTQLVYHLHAVVATVERICQIRELNSYLYTFYSNIFNSYQTVEVLPSNKTCQLGPRLKGKGNEYL